MEVFTADTHTQLLKRCLHLPYSLTFRDYTWIGHTGASRFTFFCIWTNPETNDYKYTSYTFIAGS